MFVSVVVQFFGHSYNVLNRKTIRETWQVVFAGRSNVGKSSLVTGLDFVEQKNRRLIQQIKAVILYRSWSPLFWGEYAVEQICHCPHFFTAAGLDTAWRAQHWQCQSFYGRPGRTKTMDFFDVNHGHPAAVPENLQSLWCDKTVTTLMGLTVTGDWSFSAERGRTTRKVEKRPEPTWTWVDLGRPGFHEPTAASPLIRIPSLRLCHASAWWMCRAWALHGSPMSCGNDGLASLEAWQLPLFAWRI